MGESRNADETFNLSISLGESSFTASGSPELVLSAWNEFKTMVQEPPPAQDTTNGKKRERDPGSGDKRAAGRRNEDGADRVPLPVFMKSRKWDNMAEYATGIFVWAKRHDDKEQMKPGDMVTYWKKVAKKPGRPANVCAAAAREGWLESAGSGNYAVVGHGEQMVDNKPLVTESQD
jgi:hypothetical protein